MSKAKGIASSLNDHSRLEAAGSQTQNFSVNFDLLVMMKEIVLFDFRLSSCGIPRPFSDLR